MLAGLAVALALQTLVVVTAGAAATDQLDVSVSGIRAAADYPRSHTVVATGSLLRCSSDCAVLLVSRDGGATWSRAAGREWPGGAVFPGVVGTTATLVSAGAGGIWMSSDGGESFVNVAALDGAIDVAYGRGRTFILVSPTQNHGPALITLPDGTVTAVSASGQYAAAQMWFNPAYPDVATGAPAAVAAMSQAKAPPTLQLCDMRLVCTAAGTFPAGSGVAAIKVSPHFPSDHTIFALTAKGLVESHDGGATLLPVPVAPSASSTVVSTVIGLNTTANFDASSKTGDVVAAVDSAARDGQSATTTTGIYRSADGINWQPVAGSSVAHTVFTAFALMPDGRAIAGRIDFAARDGQLICTPDWTAWSRACPQEHADVTAPAAPAGGSAPSGGSASHQTGAGGESQGVVDGGNVSPLSTTRPLASAGQPSTPRSRSPLLAAGIVLGAVLLGFSVIALLRKRALIHHQPGGNT